MAPVCGSGGLCLRRRTCRSHAPPVIGTPSGGAAPGRKRKARPAAHRPAARGPRGARRGHTTQTAAHQAAPLLRSAATPATTTTTTTTFWRSKGNMRGVVAAAVLGFAAVVPLASAAKWGLQDTYAGEDFENKFRFWGDYIKNQSGMSLHA